MLHPSYSDLMKVVNKEVEQGEAPVVSSRVLGCPGLGGVEVLRSDDGEWS